MPGTNLTREEAATRAALLSVTSYTVDLLEGTISLNLSDGTTIWGTYRGTATVPSAGQSRAALEGKVTGGTGLFAGATGTLRGDGIGGFVNDGEFGNDLEAPVAARHPEIARIVRALRAERAMQAAMSGSGSAVFGLFDRRADAASAAAGLASKTRRTVLTCTVNRSKYHRLAAT